MCPSVAGFPQTTRHPVPPCVHWNRTRRVVRRATVPTADTARAASPSPSVGWSACGLSSRVPAHRVPRACTVPVIGLEVSEPPPLRLVHLPADGGLGLEHLLSASTGPGVSRMLPLSPGVCDTRSRLRRHVLGQSPAIRGVTGTAVTAPRTRDGDHTTWAHTPPRQGQEDAGFLFLFPHCRACRLHTQEERPPQTPRGTRHHSVFKCLQSQTPPATWNHARDTCPESVAGPACPLPRRCFGVL